MGTQRSDRVPVVIRVADPAHDAEGIAAVYRPAVESSVASFELEPPTPDEMAARVRRMLERTPWLVAIDPATGQVAGYAYASMHRERAAYRWSVDVSAYVHPQWQGRGVGRALYGRLFEAVRGQRFVNAYAGITLPNQASVRLHGSVGMEPIGVYLGVGYKFGAWHDVGWFGMRLRDPGDPPDEPIGFPEFLATSDGEAWSGQLAEVVRQPA